MARKYTYGEHQAVAYGFEECEERLLIAYYADIESRIRPGAVWKSDFLSRFYDSGEGVSEVNVNFINAERKRSNLPLFDVFETQMYEYGKNRDRNSKANTRCHLRDVYLALNQGQKQDWVEKAKDDTASQPEPHYTHEEIMIRREALMPTTGGLSEGEKAMRKQAIQSLTAPPAVSDATDRILRLLLLPIKVETADRAIAKLTPNEALTIAESAKITDAELLDRLVNRAMD